MRQADLDRAVARATGETVDTVRRLGFTLVQPPPLGWRRRHDHASQRRPRRKHPGCQSMAAAL